MEHFIKDVSVFLNNLDENIHDLIPQSYLKFIEQPHEFDDINTIILYGNHTRYLDAFFNAFIKASNNVNSLIKKTSMYQDVE